MYRPCSCIHLYYSLFNSYSPDIPLNLLRYNGVSVLSTPAYKMLVLIGFWFFFFTLVLLYGSIFRTAKHHARKIHTIEVLALGLKPAGDVENNGPKKHRALLQTDVKIAKLMCYVFGLFYLTFMPVTIAGYLRFFVPAFQKVLSVRIVFLVTANLIYFHSVINPIAYAFKSRSFRRAFLGILKKNQGTEFDTYIEEPQ